MPVRTRKKKTAARKRPAASKASKALHAKRFHGEGAAYRKARDELLKAETRLRKNIESVAAMRRKLPAGGIIKEDYLFDASASVGGLTKVRLSELFTPGRNTLVVYNFMYGPNMDRPCPSCTAILDALDGNANHIGQRVDLVVVAKSPLPRILAFARERGWRRLRLFSSSGNSYNQDYFGETATGAQMPMYNVFVKQGGKIRHFWGSELLFVPPEKGQDGRHVDFIWPLWSVLDTVPDGRGTDWRPKLSY